VSFEMHLEAMIVRTCRPELSECEGTVGARDRGRLEMHSQAMIERDWRSTWRRSIWREARRQLTLY